MYFLVYQTANDINGNCYIGKHQTNNVHDGYMGSGKNLQRALDKYGKAAFSREILFVFDNEREMNSKEAELVTEEFCARSDTYNICPGGKGGWGYVNANDKNGSKEGRISGGKSAQRKKSKAQLSFQGKATQTLKVGIFNPENKPNWTGKKHSNESKMKMRRSKNAGQRNSQYGTCWIHKDGINRKCPKSELDCWIKRGYTKGRKYG